MKQKIRNILKIVCFISAFLILFQNTQILLQDKWSEIRNTYARVKCFYEEKPRPDVVFIGTSHVYCHINPLLIFQEYGISCYDFSAPGLDFSAGKLYVEEALRTGPPKIIAIDALYVWTFLNREDKDRHRQWLDALPLSYNKIKYICYAFERNKKYKLNINHDSFLSYIFPLLRYHDRWKELSNSDLDWDPEMPFYHRAIHYHGYGTYYHTVFSDFDNYYDSVTFNEDILEENKKILLDISSLCSENGVELLLIKTPSQVWRQDLHNLTQQWADEYGIPFLDYNDIIEEIGIDITTDFMDKVEHLNDNGANKVSSHLGEYLQEHYSLPDYRGDPVYANWNEDWKVYQQDKASYFLTHEIDWANYIRKLQNPNYTIYIAARDNLGGGSHPELTGLASELGLSSDLSGKAHWGYLAIIDGGKVVCEQLSEDALDLECDIDGHHVNLVSESYTQGNRASIQIDYKEYFVNQRGMGIVVYDNILEDVVDSVTFDFHGGGIVYR